MSDNPENPYESPRTEVSPVKPLTSQGLLTETMVLYLKGASPWLRFVGITGFIMLGLQTLVGLTMIIGIQNVGVPGWSGMISAGFGVFYLGLVALMFFPVFFIFQFGRKIKSYVHTGNEDDLEQAFKNNKSFWKFIGILSIISLGFVAIMIIFGGIAAIIAVASGF
ncbi:MAG: hypothetical protein LBP29_02440 [Treponema sp.]|jgi:hypothetical protein|nr:hypothetical protein [Treponema sp.]